jgi:DNA (cytosine-5)-methyltransferase 1
MRHGSLFSGIGGFDLAAEWMGWENVFHCEWNTFGQKVLHHYWPNAEQFTDITKSDFTKYANTIDILTGGFPCQPYSSAGKRLGKEDERHLWPEMLRAIREIQPRWVVGENVLGLVNWSGGLVFHEVQADLEAEGYSVQPYVLPAVSVNAPHRRDRVWFVAHTNLYASKQCNSNNEVNSSEGRFNALGNINESNGNGDASDTQYEGLEGQHREWQRCTEYRTDKGVFIGSEDKLNATNSNSISNQTRTQREILGQSYWEKTNGHSNVERRNQWQNFPTVSPICTGNDGIPDRLDSITFSKWRNESIKAGGNAIVPQVVYQIFKTIEQYENLHKV